MPALQRGTNDNYVYSVLQSIAADRGTDPTELPPLTRAVDPDALERLLDSPGTASVTFSYCGYEVTVTGDGGVSLNGD
ncbi:hypothetical protein G9464_15265 [Halostella sp. JP-L12]|uniref:HalOD1 output domain-containing protein n=1 Tax=Halostella TaxID=1843185 RepID=UPI000EF7B417|nr:MULTISPECIES: HalOD1 output domain-containing protein [Halostella]NHN48944.1 hypothetical protein [Halostella sp. JP-L12]